MEPLALGATREGVGGAALQKKVCHWERALSGKGLTNLQLTLCFWLVVQDVNSLLPAPAAVPPLP